MESDIPINKGRGLRHWNLAAKLGGLISVMLAVVFLLLIFVTVCLTQISLKKSITAELTESSRGVSEQVQNVFNAGETVINDMSNYISDSYGAMNLADPIRPYQSRIYDAPINLAQYEIESYMMASSRYTCKNNPDIAGVGVLFESGIFSPAIPSYAIYANESTADGVPQPYGEYADYSQEDFYKDPIERNKITVTPPADYNDMKIVTMAKSVTYDGKVLGSCLADINIENFSKISVKDSHYSTLFAFVMDDQGRFIYDTRTNENIGKDLTVDIGETNTQNVMSKTAANEPFSISLVRPDGSTATGFLYPIDAGDEHWWSVVAIDTKEMTQAVRTTTIWMVVISAAALAILVLVIVILLRKMLNPIKYVVTAANEISGGNLDVHIDSRNDDEIGQLAKAFDNTANVLNTIITDASYLLNELANNNFDIHTTAESSYVGAFTSLLQSMRKLTYNMSDALTQINRTSDQVASGADQVSSGAQALSQGATEQASSIQELAATINEISGQIEQNAKSAALANEKTQEVGQAVEASNRQMQEMLNAMADISSSSNEIAKIIKSIEDIAFQTNILALNAAVEAARAGAAGKGFAVVADEVRSLANKSQEASQNTALLIENSLNATANGTRIADETAASLATVVSGAKEVTQFIGQIAEASTRQAEAAEQVTQGIDQISSVVQTNSATAEQSAAASEELSSQAQILKNLVAQFRLRTDSSSGSSAKAGSASPASRSQPAQSHTMGGSGYGGDKY